MELRVAQSALEDLQAIQEHYIEESVPHIGDGYVTAILEQAEMLCDTLMLAGLSPSLV
ncbi:MULTISPECIES: type II toxin-antitoxin system RelE/ParE family toxin [unclassified Oceanobacter]|uniref:type II toxin-antitoxin system RelE/ParE family toxin n=1 Tax=unclassified Oceanobacter TaxID=2620260 RepID=UPI002737265B|nr:MULTISPECIES: type II toxin-antitoxin system RelE/ParE family toxin [unclassified Oceanobacter]MDP2506443.1 type II toxin-antitoxin system RelE/ParE family toxin [Oceanobacter sp. 3_MG-2023]MDP2548994.1 type II toxin-antitoxin system RelE/ParE family toxin [Oceanobacter sp. 4_MG-2023]MDP2609182.1 type II toxin-antitoxin system RelE/ParE family toxin [Oceanobacter sp. 1_MG-2023]MDP2612526.1 type II toxin-antitoxin system RelE/ParE family toxin [Oceanobacter sp. 2_MG-2023]